MDIEHSTWICVQGELVFVQYRAHISAQADLCGLKLLNCSLYNQFIVLGSKDVAVFVNNYSKKIWQLNLDWGHSLEDTTKIKSMRAIAKVNAHKPTLVCGLNEVCSPTRAQVLKNNS